MWTTIGWNQGPELLQIGPFPLRWYGICWAMAFITALPIWYHMFAKAGKESREAERLQAYLTFGVILGARLGHIVFYDWYDWDYFRHHLSQIFLPVVFSPKFEIVGFTGLASHGAAIGVVLVIFLYVKRIQISIFPPRIHFKNRRPAGEFLWILDHLVILCALGGAFIRIGNFMNSEIIGKPTDGRYGVVFVRDIQEDLYENHASMIANMVIGKAANTRPIKRNYQPIQLAISFKDTIQDEEIVKDFLRGPLKNNLVRISHSHKPMIYENYGTPLSYTLKKHNGGYQAIVYTLGILRHPAQLYEAFSCFLIFIALFLWWRKKGQVLAPGRIFGMFMVVLFTLRFFYEFYKENQVAFENSMWLNMGQLLSLPWIAAGLFLLLRPDPRVKEKEKAG